MGIHFPELKNIDKPEASPKMTSINKKKETTTTTHRVQEHELLRRLELLCETAGLEFPKDAWPKDDHKAYFLLGVCVTEDMKDLRGRARITLHF
jgi:hypothetical protein